MAPSALSWIRPRLPLLTLGLVTGLLLLLAAFTATPSRQDFQRLAPLEADPATAFPPGPFLEHNDSAPRAEIPPGLATRGSWVGGDSFTGEWSSGWYPAVAKVRVLVAGYPRLEGNSLQVEWRHPDDTGTSETFSLPNPGEAWRPWDLAPPAGSTAFRLRAVDGATGWGGWLALSEPVEPGAGSLLDTPSARAWVAFVIQAGLIVALGTALVQLPAFRRAVPEAWLPLAAFAAIALLAWIGFWLYFANPQAGRLYSWSLHATAALVLLRTGFRATAGSAIATRFTTLAILIGLFFFSLLLTYEPVRLSHAAANRFVSGLPSDNEIPRLFAEKLWAGQSPRALIGDWLSSDRPPLQSGWILLSWPVLARLGLDPDSIGLTGGMSFQLGWVLAVAALLRHWGLTARAAGAITAALAFTGFFLLYSVYVWPKLGAAALVITAYLFWRRGTRRDWVLTGLCAALGWVSHGGVAFSLLALLPFMLFRRPHPDWRNLLAAAFAFALVALPWSGYQKIYEPPGNRLLKWHLAGAIAPDDRTFLQALRENYPAQGRDAAWSARVINLRLQFSGDWLALPTFGGLHPAPAVRAEETSYPFRALAWWIPALLAWPWLLVRARKRGLVLGPCLQAFAWAALTQGVWIALMFLPHSAIIHQGSLAALVLLFSLLPAGALLLNRWFFRTLMTLQLVWFALAWLAPSPATEGAPVPAAIATCAIAALTLLAVIWRGSSAPESLASPPP